MIQLTYQPAFDPFHTVFRFLRLLHAGIAAAPLPRDHFRILDYYLLFPFRSDEVRVYQRHRKYKRVARQYDHTRPYGDLPDDRILFNRMAAIQGAAFDTLAKKRIIDGNAYARGLILRTEEPVPADLLTAVEKANVQHADLLEFLGALSADYQLLGESGLKDRSGLMDFAYDAA